MVLRQPISCLLLLLLSAISLTFAAAPTSFCKCTCFSNSTIIPLGGDDRSPSPVPVPGADPSPTSPASGQHARSGEFLFPREEVLSDPEGVPSPPPPTSKKESGGNCNECNRQFCLGYNLPFCKGAKEEDVFTTCFQRDSRKDKAVVFIFIFATVGLLVYAAVRPWVERWVETARERRSYIPVSGEGE